MSDNIQSTLESIDESKRLGIRLGLTRQQQAHGKAGVLPIACARGGEAVGIGRDVPAKD
jgi:hypothetical protein